MKFTKDKPTKEGFYFVKPSFSNVSYLDNDTSLEQSKISVAEIVTLSRMSMGSNLFVRFIGHKVPHSINSIVIKNTLWGIKVKGE